MIELRPYQQEAVNAVYAYLRTKDGNPCLVAPTGSGKSLIISAFCRDTVTAWNGRVLVLAHVRELLEQTVDKIHAVAPDLWHQVGIYSAGLKSRDTRHPIIVAGIQSVYRRAADLGHFDLVLIDEVHRLGADTDSMYQTLIAGLMAINPNLRIIGLTATPFRLDCGPICGPDNILTEICYEISVRQLIAQGYLCPLVTKASKTKIDTSSLHIRAGEFMADEVEQLMDDDDRIAAACKEIVHLTRDRHTCLIFCCSIEHGRHVAMALERLEQQVGTVFGDTLNFVRDQTLQDFRDGKLKYLVNVNVLTTGFDAPNIDCVVMLRPTLSPGLWAQCVGRALRLHPTKKDALILDFGGNALRHGPIDALRAFNPKPNSAAPAEAPGKECPQCQAVVATGYTRCPQCGFEFPPPASTGHDTRSSGHGVLKGQVTLTDHDVTGVTYTVHYKRGAPDNAPRSMRVEYRIGYCDYQSEWICIEHGGFARSKAEAWWKRRSRMPVPEDTDHAVALARAGVLAPTHGITVRHVAGDDFPRISDYKLGPVPEREPGMDDEPVPAPMPARVDDWESDSEVPF